MNNDNNNDIILIIYTAKRLCESFCQANDPIADFNTLKGLIRYRPVSMLEYIFSGHCDYGKLFMASAEILVILFDDIYTIITNELNLVRK